MIAEPEAHFCNCLLAALSSGLPLQVKPDFLSWFGMKKQEGFDVVVIGAGAAGTTVVSRLCSMGYKVALLDAGTADGSMKRPSQDWNRRVGRDYSIQRKSEAFNPGNEAFFVKDSENPYRYTNDHPFFWIRSRSLGGRMNLWTGECYRMSDLDFKASSRDGVGVDWPISYKDLKPHYDEVEKIFKIYGHKDGNETIPDGNFVEAKPFDGNEAYVQEKLFEQGIPVVLDRLAINEFGNAPNLHSLIHHAQKTGRLTYIPEVVVRTLKRGKSGLIEKVEGVSRRRKEAFALKAKAFFLCASTLESTRIVMNSKFKKIRSQRILGRYLTDHIGGPKGIMIQGCFATRDPDSKERMLYIPRYQNLGSESFNPFKRGFSTRVCLKRLSPFLMGFALTSFGEAAPYADNGINLIPVRDDWGSPTVNIRFKLHDNEIRMFEYMKWELLKVAEVVTQEGGKIMSSQFNRKMAGLCNHEVGTLRMGSDPEQSFLDGYCRSHDIENLYVTDGSSFPSLGTANPTLTIMALSDRACDDVAKRI